METIAKGRITITTINDPYTIILSNPAIVVPCNADGYSPILTAAKTTVQVLQGNTPVLFAIAPDPAGSTPPGIVATTTPGYALTHTATVVTIMDYTINTAIINLNITTQSGYTTTANISFAKAKQGTPATRYWIDTTADQYHESIYGITPETIGIKPMSQTGTNPPVNIQGYIYIELTYIDDINFEFFEEYYDTPGWTNQYTLIGEAECIYRITLYSSANRANPIDQKIIHYIKDGKNGAKGQIIRCRGIYDPTTTYYNDATFRDIVIYGSNNQYYIVRSNRYSVINQLPTNTSYWDAFNSFENVATNVLLAQNGIINILNTSKIFISNDNINGWEITNGAITHTQTRLTLNAQGQLSAPDTAIQISSGDTTKSLQQLFVDQERITLTSTRIAGNKNIIRNGDFSNSLNHWTKQSEISVTTGLTELKLPFEKVIRIQTPTTLTDYSNKGLTQTITLKKNTTYTLSSYARSRKGTPYVQVAIQYTDNTFDYFAATTEGISLNQWKRITKIFTTQNKDIQTTNLLLGAGYNTIPFVLEIVGAMIIEGNNTNAAWTTNEADKGADIVSSINVSPDEIKIKSDKIILDGTVIAKAISTSELNVNDKFIVSPDGTFRAKNAILEGYIDARGGTIAGFNINENSIHATDKATGETRLLITTDAIQSIEDLENSLAEMELTPNISNAVAGQTIPAYGDISYSRTITAYTENILINTPGFLVFQSQFRCTSKESALRRITLDLEFTLHLYKKVGTTYVFQKMLRKYYYYNSIEDFKVILRYDVAEHIPEVGTYKIITTARCRFFEKPQTDAIISAYVSLTPYYLKQISMGTLIGNNGFLSFWGPQHYLAFDKLTGFQVMRGGYGLRVSESGVQVCNNGYWRSL